jgi:hypothetical protein
MTPRPLAIALGALAFAAAPRMVEAQTIPDSLAHFLQGTVGFTAGDMGDLAQGKPVVKELRTSDSREVPIIGVIGIRAPRKLYVERATDYPAVLRGPSRKELGMFSDPASVADVAAFSLPHDDVQALANCRPGSCAVKLPQPAISNLRTLVDSAKPNADSVASAYFGRRAVDYVTAYRAHGDSTLVVYDNASTAVSASAVWDGFLSRSPYIYQTAPSLERFLERYPQDRPANMRDVIYWAVDDNAGGKPVVVVLQAFTYDPPELPGTTMMATKQLYCDHYLDGELELTAAVDATPTPGSNAPGTYVVLLRRLHFDKLPTTIINVRGIIAGRTRSATESDLRDDKQSTEAVYAGAR